MRQVVFTDLPAMLETFVQDKFQALPFGFLSRLYEAFYNGLGVQVFRV